MMFLTRAKYFVGGVAFLLSGGDTNSFCSAVSMISGVNDAFCSAVSMISGVNDATPVTIRVNRLGGDALIEERLDYEQVHRRGLLFIIGKIMENIQGRLGHSNFTVMWNDIILGPLGTYEEKILPNLEYYELTGELLIELQVHFSEKTTAEAWHPYLQLLESKKTNTAGFLDESDLEALHNLFDIFHLTPDRILSAHKAGKGMYPRDSWLDKLTEDIHKEVNLRREYTPEIRGVKNALSKIYGAVFDAAELRKLCTYLDSHSAVGDHNKKLALKRSLELFLKMIS